LPSVGAVNVFGGNRNTATYGINCVRRHDGESGHDPTTNRTMTNSSWSSLPNTRLTHALCNLRDFHMSVAQPGMQEVPGIVFNKLGLGVHDRTTCRSAPEQQSQIVATPVCPEGYGSWESSESSSAISMQGFLLVRSEIEPERFAAIACAQPRGRGSPQRLCSCGNSMVLGSGCASAADGV
jgi:hypothetical protein